MHRALQSRPQCSTYLRPQRGVGSMSVAAQWRWHSGTRPQWRWIRGLPWALLDMVGYTTIWAAARLITGATGTFDWWRAWWLWVCEPMLSHSVDLHLYRSPMWVGEIQGSHRSMEWGSPTCSRGDAACTGFSQMESSVVDKRGRQGPWCRTWHCRWHPHLCG